MSWHIKIKKIRCNGNGLIVWCGYWPPESPSSPSNAPAPPPASRLPIPPGSDLPLHFRRHRRIRPSNAATADGDYALRDHRLLTLSGHRYTSDGGGRWHQHCRRQSGCTALLVLTAYNGAGWIISPPCSKLAFSVQLLPSAGMR